MAHPGNIYLTIPRAVRQEAQQGNKMIENGYQGGTQTGWDRGQQLAAGGKIYIGDVKVMRDWFARHHYTSSPGYYHWIEDGSPTDLVPGKKNKYRGAVAYLIWGGESAYHWINSDEVQAAMEEAGYKTRSLPDV